MKQFEDFLICASKYGIWDLISIFVLIFSFITAFFYLYIPKNKIQYLNFYLIPLEDPNDTFPLKLMLEIKNQTDNTIILSNAYFKFDEIKPDKRARGDIPSGKLEMKFGESFSEINYLLKVGDMVRTWVPIDSKVHTIEEIEKLISDRETGKFECLCTIMKKNPKTYRLVRYV